MKIIIPTEDGERITATAFGNELKDSGVIIISPAMGVPQTFYRHMAAHFADSGYSVITFDYTGIGDSPLNKPETCTLFNWGSRDLNSVIDYCQEKYPGKDLFLIGHSVAGQIFPFAQKRNSITSAYFIASQNVSIANWSGVYKLQVFIFWYLIVPVFNNLYNGLPGFALGGNQKIPKRIVQDWAKWGRSTTGAPGHFAEGEKMYAETIVPVKFVSFDDDRLLAPRIAVEKLFESYGSTRRKHEHIIPMEMGVKSIGHFGYFRTSMQKQWEDIHKWFQE